MALFSAFRHLYVGIVLGFGSSSGVLHLTFDFLKPLKNYKGTLVNDGGDMSRYWYLSTLKLNNNNFQIPFVSYPYSNEHGNVVSTSDSSENNFKKDYKTDKRWTEEIKNKCYKYRNTINYLLNKDHMDVLVKWCTMGDEVIDPKFREILNWEFEKTCRIVLLDPSEDSGQADSGWYLPYAIHTNKFVEQNSSENKSYVNKLNLLYYKWKLLTTQTTQEDQCQQHGVMVFEWKQDDVDWSKYSETGEFVKKFKYFKTYP